MPEEERSGWKRLETLPRDCSAMMVKMPESDDCADSRDVQPQPFQGIFLAGLQHFPESEISWSITLAAEEDLIPPMRSDQHPGKRSLNDQATAVEEMNAPQDPGEAAHARVAPVSRLVAGYREYPLYACSSCAYVR